MTPLNLTAVGLIAIFWLILCFQPHPTTGVNTLLLLGLLVAAVLCVCFSKNRP